MKIWIVVKILGSSFKAKLATSLASAILCPFHQHEYFVTAKKNLNKRTKKTDSKNKSRNNLCLTDANSD